MRVVDTVIPALWIVFWLYWLAAAAGAKRVRSDSSRYSGVGIRVVVILLVLLLLRTNVLRRASGASNDPLLQGVGLAIFVLGLSTAVWARVYLGRNWGTPMSEKVDPELVTTGPYRYVRHPIYTGLILAMVGTALALSVYWLVAAAVLGAYLVYSATVEDRMMARLFPAAYPAYQRSTKMLIPFLL